MGKEDKPGLLVLILKFLPGLERKKTNPISKYKSQCNELESIKTRY